MYLIHGADGVEDYRARALDDIELDSHGRQRRENVGKHNDAVCAEGAERLQRKLDRDIGRLRTLAEGILVAESTEIFHVPASLPHEPNRGAICCLALGSAQENVVFGVHGDRLRSRRAPRTDGG